MLYTGPEELDGPVVVAVVVGFELLDGSSRIVDGHTENIRLRLVVDCGFVDSLVAGVVVAGRMGRTRLPWLVVI
jgi:hypothetical protein